MSLQTTARPVMLQDVHVNRNRYRARHTQLKHFKIAVLVSETKPLAKLLEQLR
jgi:DNA-directed RNA polymerase subunit L